GKVAYLGSDGLRRPQLTSSPCRSQAWPNAVPTEPAPMIAIFMLISCKPVQATRTVAPDLLFEAPPGGPTRGISKGFAPQPRHHRRSQSFGEKVEWHVRAARRLIGTITDRNPDCAVFAGMYRTSRAGGHGECGPIVDRLSDTRRRGSIRVLRLPRYCPLFTFIAPGAVLLSTIPVQLKLGRRIISQRADLYEHRHRAR